MEHRSAVNLSHDIASTNGNIQVAQTSHDDDADWAIIYHDPITDQPHITSAIQEGQAVLVSDGSLFADYGIGTSAFLLTDKKRKAYIKGHNATPGRKPELSSYRSELAGVIGAIALLHKYCSLNDIHHGHVTIFLDNESAVNDSKYFSSVNHLPSAFKECRDLLCEVQSRTRDLPISVTWKWIKGHQKLSANSAPEAWDNIDCDRRAKQYARTLIRNNMTSNPCHNKHKGWSFRVKNEEWGWIDRNELYNHLYSPTAMDFWAQRMRTSLKNVQLIDWAAQEQAAKSFDRIKRCQLSKFATGEMGTGKRLLHWNYDTYDRCPRCDSQEDQTHVLTCQAPSAASVWSRSLLKLEKWLTINDTSPSITKAIIDGLKQWHDGTRPARIGQSLTDKAIRHQRTLGWFSMVTGRMSLYWSHAQRDYLKRMKIDTPTLRWTSSVLKLMFHMAWDLWQDRNNTRQRPQKCEK